MIPGFRPVLLLLAATPLAAQTPPVMVALPDSQHWAMEGQALTSEYLGRSCLLLDGGDATVKQVVFSDHASRHSGGHKREYPHRSLPDRWGRKPLSCKCSGWGSNPHGCFHPWDFKSHASASFATRAQLELHLVGAGEQHSPGGAG